MSWLMMIINQFCLHALLTRPSSNYDSSIFFVEYLMLSNTCTHINNFDCCWFYASSSSSFSPFFSGKSYKLCYYWTCTSTMMNQYTIIYKYLYLGHKEMWEVTEIFRKWLIIEIAWFNRIEIWCSISHSRFLIISAFVQYNRWLFSLSVSLSFSLMISTMEFQAG